MVWQLSYKVKYTLVKRPNNPPMLFVFFFFFLTPDDRNLPSLENWYTDVCKQLYLSQSQTGNNLNALQCMKG